MNGERVYCNNMLLYGVGIIGAGFFLLILVLLVLIDSVYFSYPEEVCEALLKYGYISPSDSMIYLILVGVSATIIIFGLVISWYSGK